MGNISCAKHCVDSVARGFDCAQCQDLATTDSMAGSHNWFAQFEAQGDEAMRYETVSGCFELCISPTLKPSLFQVLSGARRAGSQLCKERIAL